MYIGSFVFMVQEVSNMVKGFQRFLNTPFFLSELLVYVDGQEDKLLNENVVKKIPDAEYNALYCTLCDVRQYFKNISEDSKWVFVSTISVLTVYNNNYSHYSKSSLN